MGAEFIPLADVLRPPRAPDPPAPATIELAPDPPAAAPAGDDDLRAALRDARLFRARLADALDAAVPLLLRELAARVLARELRIAPSDVDALLRPLIASSGAVRVRVAPAEAVSALGVPIVRDDSLASGDAVVELDGGAIDARFGTRVAVVLEDLA